MSNRLYMSFEQGDDSNGGGSHCRTAWVSE